MIGRTTGVVAICRCGAVIEVLDLDRALPGHLWFSLREWIRDGFTIQPRFGDHESVHVEPCRCEQEVTP